MSVNPWPPILLHNGIVIVAAILIRRILHRRFLSVAAGMGVGLLAGLLWRHVNFSFWAGAEWLYDPVFRGGLLTLDSEALLGFLYNWLLPVTFAYLFLLALPTAEEARRKREEERSHDEA